MGLVSQAVIDAVYVLGQPIQDLQAGPAILTIQKLVRKGNSQVVVAAKIGNPENTRAS